ncbi:MAG: type II toxin-antitoxin system RelE/ParE family toxin [Burkholderiales bacterium]|nr:type II toxin-antitoxin system RelE/ParE family toxin [Burkholderiales bacterium]
MFSLVDVLRYQCPDGSVPFDDWLIHVRSDRARARMAIRVRRLSMGIWGDVRPVGQGVVELREDEGAGYRLYVGRHGPAVVVLLCAGDKRTQQKDILRAHRFWADWKQRNS